MENDQRLTPLPVISDIQTSNIDLSQGYAGSYDDSPDGKRSIRQYFNVVYKRLPIILAITVLVTAGAALYSYRQPSIFQATTVMTIEPRKAPATRKEAININFGNDQTYYNTQLRLMQNQELMKKVVVALGLHRDPNLFDGQNRGILAGLRSLFSGGQRAEEKDNSLPVISSTDINGDKPAEIQLTPDEAARADAYSARLVGKLDVKQVSQTNIVNVTVIDSNAGLTARVADKVAEVFIQEDYDRETSGARKAYEDLGKSIDDLKAAIFKQNEDYIQEMKNSRLPIFDEKGGQLRATNLQALLAQWRDAQSDVSKFQALYTAATEASRSGDITAVVGDNPRLQDVMSQNLKRQIDLDKRIEDIQTKIDEKEQKRKELLSKYTEAYAPVVAVEAEIKELVAQRDRAAQDNQKKIKDEAGKLLKSTERDVLAGIQAQLRAAQQREGRANATFEREAAKANFEGQAETKLITLKNELAQNRSLLDTFVQRQKEQELALQTERPENIKIQSHASTPGGPIGPQRGRNILVAMIIAFAGGIGLAFLLDYLDDSVRTSDDIGRHLGLPTLALIPHHLHTEKRKLLPAGNSTANGPPNALITLDERNSPMAEAYRHLRTSLLFSSAGKPPQTILVTSSQPSEGKTTTAINTAITLAQADADVVIIDCDLRRPRLHSHFGLENAQGLTNYLSGDKSTENLMRTYADLPKLKIITSGPIPPNPAELLSSNEMRNLLTFLSGRFKHVIIDSPPAISFTDASILATLVDGVVLVAMANKSSIHLMRQFKQRMANIGARIYGVVLNGIKANSAEYYYYGSGYYNYYAKGADDATPVMEDQSGS
ncbi:MAG: polysaccharide biosynthesis tyrosine autokinase [Pyrinomonadaceae bacterium]